MSTPLLTDERLFMEFLRDNGWTAIGYSETYYPEWLRFYTFPHYEKVEGRWRMRAESKQRLGITA